MGRRASSLDDGPCGVLHRLAPLGRTTGPRVSTTAPMGFCTGWRPWMGRRALESRRRPLWGSTPVGTPGWDDGSRASTTDTCGVLHRLTPLGRGVLGTHDGTTPLDPPPTLVSGGRYQCLGTRDAETGRTRGTGPRRVQGNRPWTGVIPGVIPEGPVYHPVGKR